jgi:chitinase
MHLYTSLGFLATVVSAAPYLLSSRQQSGAQNAVYWGQNGGTATENNDLSTYCKPDSGIDIVILAFLSEWGNGNSVASGTIGQSCSISSSGDAQGCDDLASAIDTCKSNGVKVILSLGGASGAYSLQSQEQAETIGQNLWDAYGKAGSGSVPRPFGSTFVNGWDLDIESDSGNEYYQYMISKLRSNFASDPSNKYYITGAPQCPIPEPNMNEIITKAEFDYLWVQFYNNPGCSVNGPINYDDWKVNIANTPSAEAKIFIGVPASPLGATGTESGAQYYLTPSELASLVSQYDSDPAFGGVMMWSAAWSDSNVINSNTYAQQAKQILSSGSISSGSGSKSSTSTTVASPTVAPPAVAPPAVASTAVGSATVVSITAASTITLSAEAIATESETVAQWDQVRVF